MKKVNELRVFFHVKKSHFNKLKVEELKNVVRNVFGVKTRMKKQEMIDFLTNECGVNEITISGKDLTLERMYQLKEISSGLRDYGKDYEMGFVSLHHYIEYSSRVFPNTSFIPGDFTHKEYEIYNELIMSGEIKEEDYFDFDGGKREEMFDKVEAEFQKYNFYSNPSLLYSDYWKYADIDNWDDLMIPTKTKKYQIGYLREREMLGMVM